MNFYYTTLKLSFIKTITLQYANKLKIGVNSHMAKRAVYDSHVILFH